MRASLLVTAVLVLSACDQRAPPLAAYQRTSDALLGILQLDMLGIDQCSSRQNDSGVEVIVSVPVDQCFKMLPPKRYRGIWLNRFEGSTFFDGAYDVETVKAELRRNLTANASHREWLSWNEKDRVAHLPPSSMAGLVAIDFVGRRTAYPGRYGHFGMSDSEIVVDKLISARPIS